MVSKYYFRSQVINSAEEAVKNIKDGSSIAVGGFGLCGIPMGTIQALKNTGAKDLTIVSNNCGIDNWGLGILLQSKQVKRMISSYVGENKFFEQQYLSGQLELELVPQGTLAQKLRSGGAGIPAFYTPAGVGTVIEKGGFPIKYKKGSKDVQIFSKPQQRKTFNGRDYILVESIRTDVAFVRAQKADKKGNLIYNKTARNFNADAVAAADYVIAEVEEIVENGELRPEDIHSPGVYVDAIFKTNVHEKQIEKLTQRKPVGAASTGKPGQDQFIRDKIAKRATKEVKNGMYINLGIGIPTLIPSFLPNEVQIELHSENGILGVGDYPEVGKADPDLINAGKETITMIPGSSIFSSSTSFAIIRGGHLDMSFLGAMQVSRNGDLANWIIPGKMVKGPGGAIDLSCSCQVVVLMEHSAQGSHKLLESCTLPLTAVGVVDTVITEKAVFKKIDGELVLTEIASESSLEEVRSQTGFKFKQLDNLQSF